MKHLILVGLLSMIFLGIQAQEITDNHINKADSQGRKQGVWKVYNDDGNLKYTGEFANGKPMGEFIYYYPKGNTKAIINHLDSGKVSYAKNYHSNGNVMAEGKYIIQKKDSIWLYYNEEDGTLSTEENYINSKKEGIWKTYYPNGQVAEEIIYLNDFKEGPWVRYFTDGKVKLKATYVNDNIEGTYIIYNLNGKIEVSGNYLKSKKDGTWVYFNENGGMERREEYQNGVLSFEF